MSEPVKKVVQVSIEKTELTADEKAMLHTADGFKRAYFRLLPFFPTQTACYEWLEQQHEQLYKHRKYKSRESFRQSWRSYLMKVRTSSR